MFERQLTFKHKIVKLCVINTCAVNVWVSKVSAANALVIKAFFASVLCLLSSASSFSVAANYTAHVHGSADLTLAISGNSLVISLVAPAASLLGFEYQASTTQEQAQVQQLHRLLTNTPSVIAFENGQCRLASVDVNTDEMLAKKEHVKHKHAHQHDHENAAHAAAQQAEKQRPKRGADHSEIIANYVFNCDKAQQLTAITITLFEQIKFLRTINAMWLTEDKQGASVLRISTPRLEFK